MADRIATGETFAIIGARLLAPDGQWLEGHAVVVANGRIAAIMPETALDRAIACHRIAGLLVPGFIDVQVNGGGGVLFNDSADADGIAAIGAAHRRFGTTGFLPTFITDTPERMQRAVDAARAAATAEIPGFLGIHLEGPFLNPARKGIHDAALIRPITDADITVISNLARDLSPRFRVLVTLAPERVPTDALSALADAGVLLSAGHTAASAEDIATARAHGLTGFTHLFNAMPPLAGRDPGPVGAAITDPQAYIGIIADGHHVSSVSLQAAIRAHGPKRVMLVTDAMPPVGIPGDTFSLLGRTITRAGGRLTADDGTLAGSDLDMASAVRNAVSQLGVPVEEALRMAALYPAGFLRLDGELGALRPGHRASFTLLDDDLSVVATWIDGIVEQAA
ncbi:N-acetylglucosamine-6-phosphate deacetylase [Pseudochelatococcus contaminans]|uniref:N-acetylglucosamine-6-phosphate deacetylase n=1 Tax=Pseudochelatococcus contaminans TaxID=1538103 RepID=A0A7W5Z3A0_9HYPH|nr:N-acetylglucosamine-6-phosphate deacetylase [Pseudochelatococcus contaminans]MBB3809333.1 N-acetylglucosamine-6-phosphate deacetylase [Pseudochelatococcus contaminans]